MAVTLGKAARESVVATAVLIAFTLFLSGAVLLGAAIFRLAGTGGILAELVAVIFCVLTVGRYMHDRIS